MVLSMVVGRAAISIHTLRVEGDQPVSRVRPAINPISIHTLRVEGDRRNADVLPASADFYPHPPCGG